MSLKKEAKILENTIFELIDSLEKTRYRPRKIIDRLLDKLKPLALEYSIAIDTDKSKEKAKMAISEMKACVDYLGALIQKSDLDLNNPENIEIFWEKYSIFQEIKYKNDEL